MRTNGAMPKSFVNRVTVVTVMLVGAFIFWIWEGGLISFVSVRKTTLPIKTLQDVLEKSNLKVREKHDEISKIKYQHVLVYFT